MARKKDYAGKFRSDAKLKSKSRARAEDDRICVHLDSEFRDVQRT